MAGIERAAAEPVRPLLWEDVGRRPREITTIEKLSADRSWWFVDRADVTKSLALSAGAFVVFAENFELGAKAAASRRHVQNAMRSRRARSLAAEADEMPVAAESDATGTRLVRVDLACSAVAVTATLTPGETKTEPLVAAGETAKAEPMEMDEAAGAAAESAKAEGTEHGDAADAAVAPATGADTAAPPAPSRPETPFPEEKYQGTATRAGWKRPALERCAPEDFMFDFLRAAEARGDDWECVWDYLDNALRRTGKPCDVLGLYKEVCMRGGYVSRESAKRRIKMGYAFMQTHNFYRNHTYTDIGNKLLDLYERLLLPYENEHPEDITTEPCVVCGDETEDQNACTLSKARCDACAELYHRRCAGDGAFSRASRLERFTSFVCASCARSGGTRVRPPRGGASNAEPSPHTVVTVVSREGSRTKRTLAEIDARNCAAADEALARCVAMRVRRGRAYEADFAPPTRRAETEEGPSAVLVGPAL